jgi:hypothetical protein
VAQISEIEQYLKKQEDAIDEEKEAIQIKTERLLKLPGRKAQVATVPEYMDHLTDEDIMSFTDFQWNDIIVGAQTKKLAAQQKEIDDAKALEVEKRTVERVNQLTATGAVLYFNGLGKVYRKGSASISEQMVKDCIDEGWPKIVEVFQNAVIPPKPESAPAFRVATPTSQPIVKEVSDEEKLFRYASALESVTVPDVKTPEGIEVLKNANKLINEAINLLRK